MPRKKKETPLEEVQRQAVAEAEQPLFALDELTVEKVDQWIAETPEEQLREVERLLLAEYARIEDSPDGFAAYYKLMHGIELAPHLRGFVELAYRAKKIDKGALIWSFRGSWKTTTLTVDFCSFRIGHNPARAYQILRSSDESGELSAEAVANIIEYHSAWKMTFPYIVPDKKKGWGAMGYEVMDMRMSYEGWRELNSERKDPTLIGAGYNSRKLIGTHPDGGLFIDDIHDDRNSVSMKERESVVRIVLETIMPTVVRDATREAGQKLVSWVIVVGTPWDTDDTYHVLINTGEFLHERVPVMARAEEGEEGAIQITDEDTAHNDLWGWWKLTWPERFPKGMVISTRNLGKRAFWKMYMLDISKASETGIKYQLYPSKEIDLKWHVNAGVDYASTVEIRGKVIDTRYRNRFAMCYGMEIPTGKAVIYDGVSGQISQAQAEGYIQRAQGLFPNYGVCAVEMNGKGEEFYSVVSRHPTMRLLPFYASTGRAKKDRIERVLEPLLEVGMVMISDADTPFLNTLRNALDDWPNGDLDEIDSVYSYLKTIPQLLNVPVDSDLLPIMQRAVKKRNPYLALGRR